MAETETKRTVKVKRRAPWPADRPRPEAVPPEKDITFNRTRVNGTSTKKRTTRKIRPGVNSYSLYGQRELVIAELLKQPSIPRTARKLGISPKTIQKWLRTEEFAREYDDARRQVLELSISTVGQHVTEAVDTLARNLHCGRSDSEIRAAAVILQWAGKFIPGIDQKVAAEKLAAAQAGAGPAGATIIVVDGGEDDYVRALEQGTQ